MPKICCFFEKLEEIKKKLNKIKKLMGETFQNLRTHGKSVVVERQKNIVIERSEDSIITRKQTIIREKILNDDNTLSPPKKPHKHISQTAKAKPNTSARTPGKEDKIVNSKRTTTTTTTTTASPLESSFLPNPTKAFSALELAALKQDIDDEITNLKLQRNTLLKQAISTARENAKMREKKPVNTQIQNDMTWDQNFSTPRAETIEVQYEKFSSEHNVRHKRDEQTSCRPRMRTIGLQKNTQRSAAAKSNNIPAHNSLLNLKYNSTCEAIPTAFACFDYGPNCTVNDYYRNPNQSHSHSGCQNYCQRYNLTGDYNGVVCNQNTYRQMGRTPCTEYNYCRDEYYYDYSNMSPPQQRSQVQEATWQPRLCYCHGDCRHNTHRRKKRSHHYEHKKGKGNRIDEYEQQLLTKKYLLQQITKQQRDLEREEARALALRAARLKLDHLETERNAHRDKKEHKIEKWQEESAARIASLITRNKLTSKKTAPIDSDSDTEEQKYQLKKEKLKVSKKQSYRVRKVSSRGDHGYYEDISSDGTRQEEYNVETKRTLEKMRIHAYKPSPKRDSARLSKVAEDSGKSVKKEKRYAEYITQYKQDPLTTNLEAHKNVQTSITLSQQGHHFNRLESVADEVGLIPKTTDLKSTQTSSINSRPIPKMYSNKRISAHDGNEQWNSPHTTPQFDAQKQFTKEDFAQTEKLTTKPAEYQRRSSVGTNSPQIMRRDTTQNEQHFGIKEDKATSPLGGSFLSRDDAYQRGSKKAIIPPDISPLERLAREESLSQDSRGQTIQEQLSMRDHLFRGEYFPLQDSPTFPDKSIDENLSVRDRIIKVESFDAGTRETTIEKVYSLRSLRDKLSPEVIQEEIFVERVSTSDRIILEDSPQYHKEDNLPRDTLQDSISKPESLKPTVIERATPRSSLARGGNTPHENRESINQRQFLTPVTESHIPVIRNIRSLEDGSPHQRLTREWSFFKDSRKESYSAESKKLSNPQETTPRENLRREGSYSAESRKKSIHEASSPREFLTKEADYMAYTPKQSTQAERSPQERLTREGNYITESRKRSTLEQSSPRERLTKEGSYVADNSNRRSPRERLTREGSYVADNSNRSNLEERSPRERLTREGSYLANNGNLSTLEERSSQERLPREGSYSAEIQMLNTQEERIPREYLTRDGSYTAESRKSLEHFSREGSYTAESRKRSTQERTPRESLIEEGSFTAESRKLSTQEKSMHREHFTREGSYTAESRRLSTQEPRTPQESLRRQESYTPERRMLSAQEEHMPSENLTREGSYTAESRRLSTQEPRTQRESLRREESYIPERRKLSAQEESMLREYLTREGGYSAESRNLSKQEPRTPPESLRRQESYTPERRKLSAQEERTPREYLTKEGSYIPDTRKLSNQEDLKSPEYFSREGSHIAESRKHSGQEERTPRGSLGRDGSYTAEGRKLSNQEKSIGGSYFPEDRKLSTQEERTPREYLPRDSSYISKSRKESTQDEHVPREFLSREKENNADSRKHSNYEERAMQEYLTKDLYTAKGEESFLQDTPKQSIQEVSRGPLTREGSYIQNTQEVRQISERLPMESNFLQNTRKLRAQEERSPRKHLSREESFQQGSQKRANLEESSPQASLIREKSYIQDTHEVGSLQERREESYIQENRKGNTQQEHSPREHLSRETSFLQGSRAMQDNSSPREHLTRERLSREASFMQGSRVMQDNLSPLQKLSTEESRLQESGELSTPKNRSPQESLRREESYSPRRSTKEERTKAERLTKETYFLQESRDMQESLSPRERLTRENSIIEQSRKENPQERTPRESLTRERSYIRHGSNQSTLEEQSDLKNLTREERLSREKSFLQESGVTQDKLSPRERLTRDHSSRKGSTLEEATPRERLSREASFIQGSRIMQNNLSPRTPSTRAESLLQSSEEQQQIQNNRVKQTEYDKIISKDRLSRQESLPQEFLESPHKNLTKETSFQRGNRVLQETLSTHESLAKEESNIRDNQKHSPTRTPRESFIRQQSNLQDNRKRSTLEQRTPRGSLTREGSFLQDKPRQSSPEKRTPRGSLTREGSFLQDKRRQSSPEKRSPGVSLTKEETNLQDRRKRSTQDERSPRVTKEESFVKGRREQNTLDHKPLRKRFKESVHEKVIPQNRLAKIQANQQEAREPTLGKKLSPKDQVASEQSGKRSSQEPRSPRESSTKKDTFLQGGQETDIKKNETSHEDKEETIREQEQLPAIQPTPAEEESNFEDSGKERTPLTRSPRESLGSPKGQGSPQRRRSTREESSFIASQLMRNSLSPRRSTREESFARSTKAIRDSLMSRKRLSNTQTPASARRSTYVIPNVHKRSTLHIPDTQSLRRSTLHPPDVGRKSALNLLEIARPSTPHVPDSRRRSTHLNEPPRWTKEEILYPYLTYSHETRDPYAFRKSNIPQGSQIKYEYDRPPQEPIPAQKIADPPAKEKPNNENRKKKEEPRKSLSDDCEIPPVICPEICDDTPYECVPCIVEPETPCISVYETCQTLNAQNERCYDPRSTPINAQAYHEREMIYTNRECEPCVTRCCGRMPKLGVRDNTYDERPTTTTTASSQASCSDYPPYRPLRQMLICIDPLAQQLQQEQQTLQVETMPQFLPSQQFETEDELAQRLDLESRLQCCDAIQQENMYYCDGNEIKCVSFEPSIDQNYTEDDDCRCGREMLNNVDYSNESYEQTMHDYIERQPSNCTITSAYATASSGVSCNCQCNNEEMDPPEYQPQQSNPAQHQNRVIPEYTGCPCMLATYLDMMGLTADNEKPKEKDECVKRISFR